MREDAPTTCGWCWSGRKDDVNEGYRQHELNQDPAALGHHLHHHRKMASPDEEQAEQSSSPVAGYARPAPDRGIPGHVGSEKQLHSGTGYNLVIDSEDGVYGTREPFSEEAILQFYSRRGGEVQIRGKKSQLYLAMNGKGRIYAEADQNAENTWFKETYEGGYNRYMWLGNDQEWFLGIKRSGKMKKGPRTNHSQQAVKFLPRSAQPPPQ